MLSRLTVIKGPDQGRGWTLDGIETLTIGRGDSSDTALADPFVSRVHCVIQRTAQGYLVMDSGSASGIEVNGQRIVQHLLAPGDIIGIGETQLVYACELTAADIAAQAARHAPSTAEGPQQRQLVAPSPHSSERLGTLIGKRIHCYQIKKLISPGTTGVVFAAIDEERNRPVALKVLWPELSQVEEEVQRFIRAMRTMQPLRHPNLIRVHGAGKTKTSGLVWTSMEYVPGISLVEAIEQVGIAGMLDWRYAFRVMVHVARALEVAHAHDILHRNITPRNILVRSSDKVVKLGDLMLAKALSGSMAESVTRPGLLVGELAYMAPECTLLDPTGELDPRADLYSLGATAYAVLTGRPPFAGKNLVELIQRVRHERPASPTSFQMSIFAQFEGVVMRLLAKEPSERFASASELLEELQRIARFQGLEFD